MKARAHSMRPVTGAPSGWPAAAHPPGVPASAGRHHPARTARGFSTRALIPVPAILALLAASITPVWIRQVDQAALTTERADLLAVTEAFQHTSRRDRAVIGERRYAIDGPASTTPGAVHEAVEAFAAAHNPWTALGTWPKSPSRPVFQEATAAPSAMSQVALDLTNQPAEGRCV